MWDASEHLTRPQVVDYQIGIKRSGTEHAHLLVNEDWGDRALMVIILLEVAPTVRIVLSFQSIIKRRISPEYNLTTLSSSNQALFIRIDCNTSHGRFMLTKFKHRLCRVFKWTEYNTSIPEPSLDHILPRLGYLQGRIKFLTSSILLGHSLFKIHRVKLPFEFTTQREGNLGVLIMWLWQKHEILGTTFFLYAQDVHIVNELSVQNGLWRYELVFVLLLGNWFEYF